jgi:hypothetical protein
MAAPDSAFPLLPDEDVRHAQPATTLLTAGARGLAPIGTLFITTLCAATACAVRSRRAPVL